jgi:hypothetical protein
MWLVKGNQNKGNGGHSTEADKKPKLATVSIGGCSFLQVKLIVLFASLSNVSDRLEGCGAFTLILYNNIPYSR